MCFAIPFKVLRLNGDYALIEGGKKIKIGPELSVHTGDYLQVTGSVAVAVIPQVQGLKIRQLIKKLNENV